MCVFVISHYCPKMPYVVQNEDSPNLEIVKPETLINKANVLNDGPIVAQILL